MTPFLRTTLISLLLCGLTPHALAQPIDACDWEVGHPSDPDRVGPGVGSGAVDTDRAIAACQAAVAREPDNARFQYQLGRAMVYAADRSEGDWRPAMPHLEQAAAGRHRQAMFVLGLMYLRDGKACDAEPWTRAAADDGLKSARISYVNHVQAGTWGDCELSQPPAPLNDYLNDARDQVSGYYENMLLDALGRQLDARKDDS